MGKNMTEHIVWGDDGIWFAAIDLQEGDFFWYEVDPGLEAMESKETFGEIFLNGEGIAVVIIGGSIPSRSTFEISKKMRPLLS